MVNSKITLLVFAGSALSAVVPREDTEAGHDHPAGPEGPRLSAPWGPPGSEPTNAEYHFSGHSIGDEEHGLFPQPEFTMSAPLQAAATGAPGAGPFPEQQHQHGPTSSFSSITKPTSEGSVSHFGSEQTPAPQMPNSFHPVDGSDSRPLAPGSSHIVPPPRPSAEHIRPMSIFTQTPRPQPSNGAPSRSPQDFLAGNPPSFDHPKSPFSSHSKPPGPPSMPTQPANPSEDSHPKEPPHPSGPDGLPGKPPEEHPQQPHPEGQQPHSYSDPPSSPETGSGEPPRSLGPEEQLSQSTPGGPPGEDLHPSQPEGHPPRPGPNGPPGEPPHSPQPEGQQPHTYDGPPPSQPNSQMTYPYGLPPQAPPHGKPAGPLGEGRPTKFGDHQGGQPQFFPGGERPPFFCPCAMDHGRAPFGEEASGPPAGPSGQASGPLSFPGGIPEQHNDHPVGEPAGGHDDHLAPPHSMPEAEEQPESPQNPHSAPPVMGPGTFYTQHL